MKKILCILMFAILLISVTPASASADEVKIKVTKEHFEQIDKGVISQPDLEQYAPEGILKKDWYKAMVGKATYALAKKALAGRASEFFYYLDENTVAKEVVIENPAANGDSATGEGSATGSDSVLNDTRLCISQEDFDRTVKAMQSTSATTRKNSISALFKSYGNGMTGLDFYAKYFGSSTLANAANNVYTNGLGTYCYVAGADAAPVHVHTWIPATCEEPGKCSECGERNLTDSVNWRPLGHKLYLIGNNWVCSVCGKIYTSEDLKQYESYKIHENSLGEEASDYHMVITIIPNADFWNEHGLICYDINNEPLCCLYREELHNYQIESDGIERCACGSMRPHTHTYTEYKGYETPDKWNRVSNIVSICDQDGCSTPKIVPNDYSNGISDVTGSIDIVGLYDYYKEIYKNNGKNFNACLVTWVEQYGFSSVEQLKSYVADMKIGVAPYEGEPSDSSATRFWDWFYSIDYQEDPAIIHGNKPHVDHFDIKNITLKEQ